MTSVYDSLQKGQTLINPFIDETSISKWLDDNNLPADTYIADIFGGKGLLRQYLYEDGIQNVDVYDILEHPTSANIRQNDSLLHPPQDYDVIVTNPPWLDSALNSRNKVSIPIPEGYRNLAFYALQVCLENASRVCALLPASFLSFIARNFDQLPCLKKSFKRLSKIGFLDPNTFTEKVIGVIAFFEDEPQDDFEILKHGMWSNFKDFRLPNNTDGIRTDFEQGNIGARLVSSGSNPIRFVESEDITRKQHTEACRFNMRIKVPWDVTPKRANDLLASWIKNTKGIFLTPYRLNADKTIRRRLLMRDAFSLLAQSK